MIALPWRWKSGLLALSVIMVIGACTVTGVGYGEDDYVGGYYEPYGYEYGGWGHGYWVGPPGGGYGGGWHGGGSSPGHPYRSPSPGRSMPSIPGRPRGR